MENNRLYFNSLVAMETYNLSTALLLQRFKEIAEETGSNRIEIHYGKMFPKEIEFFMSNRLHLLNTIRLLEEFGYGELIKGNGAKRIKPIFVLSESDCEADKYIEYEYLINDGIKLRYVHNILVRFFKDRKIDLHESELVDMILEECADTISGSGIRKSLITLCNRGYLTYIKGQNKGKNSKKREGYKIYQYVKPL
ncbi:hypothetical protein EYB35_07240 [Bacillus paranthracis]|nr:hypothetical protein EYB35_07240 [Bacillus paranthracis]